jgi:hypothetical protein
MAGMSRMQRETPRLQRRASEAPDELGDEGEADPVGRVLDTLLINKALVVLMRLAMTVTPLLVGMAWNAIADVSKHLADEQTILARYGDRIDAVESKAREADLIALQANQLGAVTQGRFNDLMNRVLHIEQVVTERRRSDNADAPPAPPG